MFKNWTLKKKIFSATIAAMGAIAISGGIVHKNVLDLKEAQKWVVHTDGVIAEFEHLLAMMIDMETGQRGYLMSGDKMFLEPYNGAVKKFDPALKELQQTVSDNPVQMKRLDEMLAMKNGWLNGPAAQEMQARADYDAGVIDQYSYEAILKKGLGKEKMDAFRALTAAGIKMEDDLNVIRKARSNKVASATMLWIQFGIFGSILMGFFLMWRVSNSVVGDIQRLSSGLSTSSIKLNTSSHELDESSQSLANSSQSQSTNIQQTAASLEEISATVKSTASLSRSAADESAKASEIARSGQHTIQDLQSSMDQILESNQSVFDQMNENNTKIEEIGKIIEEIDNKTRVIDDIVFQTKLLSFNASVEAARAGEHGKGFAVVAEEVGNLAQMSGESAQEIQEMLEKSKGQVSQIVEETRQKVGSLLERTQGSLDSGKETANLCGQSFEEIASQVSEVDSLNKKISVAADEQTQGVEQINTAIQALDSITQGNASSAAQTSSLSSALSEQSQVVAGIVTQLGALVGLDTNAAGESYNEGNPPSASNLVELSTAKDSERRKAS